MDKYITISEAADRLNVSKETLRRWDKSGKFKSYRHPINNYRVYTEEQIKSLVNDVGTKYVLTKEKLSLEKFFFRK